MTSDSGPLFTQDGVFDPPYKDLRRPPSGPLYSNTITSPAAPEFNPKNTKVSLPDLNLESISSWKLAGQVLGNSDDAHKAITGSATQFSELVSEDIKSSGKYNRKAWQEACMVLTFSASIADLWYEEVDSFQRKRQKLIKDYEKEISTARILHPANLQDPTDPNSPLQMKFQNIQLKYEHDGNYNHAYLMAWARKLKEMLNQGPTPENLKFLVKEGTLGWGVYNIEGAKNNPPLPLDKDQAKKMAIEIEKYLNGDKDRDARYHEILAAFTAITNTARHAQLANRAAAGKGSKNLERLGEEEIEFLQTFYEELEERSPHGVTRLMPWLEGHKGPDWTEAQRKEFARPIASGLLVLSDDKLGGGLDKTPFSVQRFASGLPPLGLQADEGRLHGNDKNNWLMDARDMGRLLDLADGGIRGGTEFSSNVTLAAGHYLKSGVEPGLTTDSEEGISSLLKVTTRNEEANHKILTGGTKPPWEGSDDGRYKELGMPEFGTNSDALVGLYTHDWDDGGVGVTGLTDWIPGAAEGNAEEQKMARESAEGLIRMTTGDDEVFKALVNTGNTVKEEVWVGNEKVEVEYPDASFTRVNPALAGALGDIALHHIADFSVIGDKNEVGAEGDMRLSYLQRQRFLQFAVTDNTTVEKLYGAAGALDLDSTHRIMVEDGGKDAALRSSTFRAVLDAAVQGDVAQQGLDLDGSAADKAAEEQRKIAIVSGLAFGTANLLPPGPGGLAIAGVTAATYEFNDRINQSVTNDNYANPTDSGSGSSATDPFGPTKNGRTYSELNHEYKTKLDLLDALVRSGKIDVKEVERVSPLLLSKDGRVVDYYEYDTNERTKAPEDGSGPSPDEALERLLSEGRGSTITSPSGQERTAFDAVDKYTGAYKQGYNEVFKHLVAEIQKQDQASNNAGS